MNPTRKSKIARLPQIIRHDLSQRLEDGELAADLVYWLNNLPVVREIISRLFKNQPITESNLSDWRAGGHQDWLREQDHQARVETLAEQDDDREKLTGDCPVSERLARRMELELLALAELRAARETDPDKLWDQACALNRELARLRSGHHRATKNALAAERLNWHQQVAAREEAKREAQANRQRQSGVYVAKLSEKNLADKMGGGETGLAAARTVLELRHDLPPGRLNQPINPEEARFDQTHPHWNITQLRDEVIQAGYAQTLTSGDFQAGHNSVAAEMKSRLTPLAEEEFVESQRLRQAKALEICLSEAKAWPAVMDKFREAFRALTLAQGNIRPEV